MLLFKDKVCLVCPSCHNALHIKSDELICEQCKNHYKIKRNIPIFDKNNEYWCNVNRDQMLKLIDVAETSGDWLSAVNKYIPDYAGAIVPFSRADAQFIFPIDKNSRVLDAGCMWGGLTIPIAQFCKEVYAIDKTWETVKLLDVRAKQMNLNNIVALVSPVNKLPLPDDFFDFIVLNGVLEWLGYCQDFVGEEHYGVQRKNNCSHILSPSVMQQQALTELFRVLKPGGGIYIAIENRIGIQYFFGYPDDHVGIKFTNLLPRRLASYVTRKLTNTEYRTYTYSPNGLRTLLKSVGFKNINLYSVFPDYRQIWNMVPCSHFNKLRRVARSGFVGIKWKVLFGIWGLIPANFAKNLSPSLAVIASKEGGGILEPRLLSLLNQRGLLRNDDCSEYKLILANNRLGNGNSVNYFVYDDVEEKTKYFCKVARKIDGDCFDNEAVFLKKINLLFGNNSLKNTVPRLRAFCCIDGIKIMVTDYVRANHLVVKPLRLAEAMCFYSKNKIALMIKRIITRLWLRSVDSKIMRAMDWLVAFQRETDSGKIFNIGTQLDEWLKVVLKEVESNDVTIKNLNSKVDCLRQKIMAFKQVDVPMCMEQGDFDSHNILFFKKEIFVTDFEHAKDDSLPFFDLACLMFNGLISEWRANNYNLSLIEYAFSTGWSKHLRRWVKYYASISGLPYDLLCFLPALAAIEQNAKKYPGFRNAYDYPMFGGDILENMLDWKL